MTHDHPEAVDYAAAAPELERVACGTPVVTPSLAELAADRRDAQRYRFLRAREAESRLTVECMDDDGETFYHINGAELDATLDEEMSP